MKILNRIGQISLPLMISLGAILLAATTAIFTNSAQRSKSKVAATNFMEGYYASEIAAQYAYAKVTIGGSVQNNSAVPLVNSYSVTQGAQSTYNPTSYTTGTPLPLASTSGLDPLNAIVRRLASNELTVQIPTNESGVYCGQMTFPPNSVTQNCISLPPVPSPYVTGAWCVHSKSNRHGNQNYHVDNAIRI